MASFNQIDFTDAGNVKTLGVAQSRNSTTGDYDTIIIKNETIKLFFSTLLFFAA